MSMENKCSFLTLMVGFCLFFNILSAQSIERQVIGAAGTVFTNGNVSMSFTIGETMVSSYDNGSYWLTEGFQQGFVDPIAVDVKDEYSELGARVYPNPFVSDFSIELDEGNVENYDVLVLNLLGESVHFDRSNLGQRMDISLSHHTTGIYFVQIYDNGQLRKTIKLNKVLY